MKTEPKDKFIYDESSPSCLRWKHDIMAGRDHKSKIRSSGDEAGTLNIINKMWHVQFRGSPKPAHRIIWEMFHKEVDVVVTFIDGDTSNCKLSNLQARKAVLKSLAAECADAGKWNDIFELSGESPSGLIWKIDNYTGYLGTVLKASANSDVYAFTNSEGYYCISLGAHVKSSKKLHKILYEMRNGPMSEGMVVDHIDGDIVNNKEENLRAVPLVLNARNRKLTSRNKTGVNGVNKKEDSFRATWSDLTGRSCEKSFSTSKYGEDEAFILACEYRFKMIQELNLQNAGYTERHGT